MNTTALTEKAKALIAKNAPVTAAKAPTPEEKQQVANLNAAIDAAAQGKEAKEKKTKEKINISQAINVTRDAGGQGRQPQKIVAGQMPAFLAGFFFASASARVKKPEAELQKLMMEGMKNGKMTEMLANDAWQYEQIAPDTRTGEQWKNDAPETVFLLSKGTARAAVLAEFDANWEDAFGKEENENPNPLIG